MKVDKNGVWESEGKENIILDFKQDSQTGVWESEVNNGVWESEGN